MNFAGADCLGKFRKAKLRMRRRNPGVQILDLPDTSQKTRSEAETVALLAEWTNQLRVPDPETGKLQQSNWSFDIKRYRIQ